jgi:hypothetical protein
MSLEGAKAKVTKGTKGGFIASLDTGPEEHPDITGPAKRGGAHVVMSSGSINPYNGAFNSTWEAGDHDDPNGQIPLLHVERPSVNIAYASKKGRAYMPQLLALARKHAVDTLGVVPTHSTTLSPDSSKIVKRAVKKGWVVKNPDWNGGTFTPTRSSVESEFTGLVGTDMLNSTHINARYNFPYDMETPQDGGVGGIIDEGKSEVERLVRGSIKYPIVSRGPSAPMPGQGGLF